jgi:hypothetical protein
MINTWIQFENDICDGCNAPKYGKLLAPDRSKTLKVIISCDCDEAVFAEEWKRTDPADLIVVLDPDGVNSMLRMMAEMLNNAR